MGTVSNVKPEDVGGCDQAKKPKDSESKSSEDCTHEDWVNGGSTYEYKFKAWNEWNVQPACGPTTATRTANFTCVRKEKGCAKSEGQEQAEVVVDVDDSECESHPAGKGKKDPPKKPDSKTIKEGGGATTDKDKDGKPLNSYTTCIYSWCLGDWSEWESKPICGKHNKTRTRTVGCCRSDGTSVKDCFCSGEEKCSSAMNVFPAWGLIAAVAAVMMAAH